MKRIFLFSLFCLTPAARAMQDQVMRELVQRTVTAASSHSLYDEVKMCLDQGVDVHSCNYHFVPLLELAAIQGHSDLCELLIQRGAEAGKASYHGNSPLIHAASMGYKETVRVLLTTIPPQVSKSIEQCMPGLICLRHAQPELPKDVCRFIGQKLVDLFVEDQWPRVESLITFRERRAQKTAGELAFYTATPIGKEIARMLDLSNPQARKMLLAQLDANTKRILFGEPSVIIIRRANQP